MEKKVYLIILIILVIMVLHLELTFNKDYAPKSVLIKVVDSKNLPEENANCLADIISSEVNIDDKPLVTLKSVYDFLDPSVFYLDNQEGYYYLETGFEDYEEDYEIRIVCRSEGFKGVSYTVINKTNNLCEFRGDGKVLFC